MAGKKNFNNVVIWLAINVKSKAYDKHLKQARAV